MTSGEKNEPKDLSRRALMVLVVTLSGLAACGWLLASTSVHHLLHRVVGRNLSARNLLVAPENGLGLLMEISDVVLVGASLSLP